MADKPYKVNESIKVVYQAPNAASGLVDVTMEIYNELGVKDSDFPDVTLTEMGNSGRYQGEFTPDEEGEWTITIESAPGEGEVVKHYSVGSYNIASIGTKIETCENNIRGENGDTLKSISDQLDSTTSPPMVS